MKCRQAKLRLTEYSWRKDDINRDAELTAHLDECQACRSLVMAEWALQADMNAMRQWEPEADFDIAKIRARVDAKPLEPVSRSAGSASHNRLREFLFGSARRKFAIAGLVAALVLLTLMPLNFREQVGYEIAIDGVGKDIAVDNQKITSLLGALGMESKETTNLLDSLEANQITFSIGECSETCRLTISDLKTERDVRLMVKAIIDLGCCQINGIIPVFRNETTSILEYTAKKLLS